MKRKKARQEEEEENKNEGFQKIWCRQHLHLERSSDSDRPDAVYVRRLLHFRVAHLQTGIARLVRLFGNHLHLHIKSDAGSKCKMILLFYYIIIILQNILCATGLLALHYKKLQVSLCQSFNEATRTVAGETADHQDQQRQCLKRLKCSPVNDTAIYWSLSLCFTIILINSINAIVCEVGEWNVWISASEVQVLHSATPLGKIAQQGHHSFLYKT